MIFNFFKNNKGNDTKNQSAGKDETPKRSYRILVFSDSHGKDDNMFEVMEKERFDMIFHLGDVEGSEDIIKEKSVGEAFIVKGNCDYFCDLPISKTVRLNSREFFLIHGDGYVNVNPESLTEMTDADVIFFGHTHVPYEKQVNGRLLYNPGSISKPRTTDRIPSYGVLEIDEDGNIKFQHVFLK